MGKQNIARGNDRVAVQVGRIVPPDGDSEEQPTTRPPRKGGVRNVREDDAQVGEQADVIDGPVNTVMRRRQR